MDTISNEGLSRRRLLKQVAPGSSAATLGAGFSSAQAVRTGTPSTSPVPVTSYPVVGTKGVAAPSPVKIVSRVEIPPAYQERILSLSPSLKLKACPAEEEFQREVSDAQILYGYLSR